MSETRSPRYPSMSLEEAISSVAKIFKKEHRNSMPKEVAVTHIGYGSVNGASLSALSALKKYGLLEGRGEDLRVSEDAVCIIADAGIDDQADRAAALRRSLMSFDLFAELAQRFGGRSSEANLVAFLTKAGFKPEAARTAARSYLESFSFVEREAGEYNSTSIEKADSAFTQSEETPMSSQQRNYPVAIVPPLPSPATLSAAVGQQVGASIPVAKNCSISILATGEVTQAGIDKLINYLNLIRDSFPESPKTIQ